MGSRKPWTKLLHIRWHQWARIVASILLIDQFAGAPSGMPSSEAIIVACIGALFAPVPVEKEKDQK